MEATSRDPSGQPLERGAAEEPLPSERPVLPDETEPSGPDLPPEPSVVESSEPAPLSPSSGSHLVRLSRGYLLRDVLMLAMLLFVVFGSIGLVVLRGNEAHAEQRRRT